MPTWKLEDGRVVDLLTPKQLKECPDGTVLLSILGKTVTKGVDEIDDDTRGGFLAFGIEVHA